MPEASNSKKEKKTDVRKQEVQASRRLTAITKKARARSVTRPTLVRADSGARLLQTPQQIWYQPLTWRNRPPVPVYKPLPKARKLFWRVLKQLWANRKLFGGVVLVYGLLNILLVRGLSGSSSLTTLKGTLDGVFHGVGGKLVSSSVSFGYLLASSGSGNTNVSGAYQGVLFVACSLAFIWALRQVVAKHTVRIRDTFYQGMYPLVPFVLVIVLLSLQLLPLAAGGGIYAIVVNNGIAVHVWEKLFWIVLFIALGVWSLRMLTATIFALYIVTLPDETPMHAYRSARRLVYGRRLLIWRKLIFLPVVLVLLAAAIELPLIYFLTPVAVWAFFVISMVALPVVHGYLYNLYREML